MHLVVKIYPGGAISQHLAHLEVGDTIEIRGPKGAMKYHKFLTRHIGMVAGGTGITPMYSLIRAICENDEDETTVSLLYANQTEKDILMREELDAYAKQCPQKFSYYNVLSNPPEAWTQGRGRVTKELMMEKLPKVEKESKFLLCGPDGMVADLKQALAEMGCGEPSAVSRASDQVFSF